MQPGLKMFLVKMLFVVSWFSQFSGVCAVGRIKGAVKRLFNIRTFGVADYCNDKSCFVAICETDESIGKMVPKTKPTAAVTPSDPPQRLNRTEEWEAVQEWDPMTAIGNVKPRDGCCALVLASGKEKVKESCQSYCNSRFSCEWPDLDKADKATISRLAVKRERMRYQLEKEERWKRRYEWVTDRLEAAEKVKKTELEVERRNSGLGWVKKLAHYVTLRERVEVVNKRNDKVIYYLFNWLYQRRRHPPCTGSDSHQ